VYLYFKAEQVIPSSVKPDKLMKTTVRVRLGASGLQPVPDVQDGSSEKSRISRTDQDVPLEIRLSGREDLPHCKEVIMKLPEGYPYGGLYENSLL